MKFHARHSLFVSFYREKLIHSNLLFHRWRYSKQQQPIGLLGRVQPSEVYRVHACVLSPNPFTQYALPLPEHHAAPYLPHL